MLGLAVPLVIARSTSIATMNGLLIRDRIGFEKVKDVTAVIFDKTGTLTLGEFGITDIIVLNQSMGEGELLSISASLELHSEHPIAQSIVDHAKKIGVELVDVEEFKSLPGRGVEGKVKCRIVKVVSLAILER